MPRTPLVIFTAICLLACSSLLMKAAMSPDEVSVVLLNLEKANKGVASAQFNLAMCYAEGKGVDKDPGRAFTWARKAADQGYAPAQSMLSRCYRNGDGVASDEVEAFAWLSLAAHTVDQARIDLGLLGSKLTSTQQEAGRKRAKALQAEIEAMRTSKLSAK